MYSAPALGGRSVYTVKVKLHESIGITCPRGYPAAMETWFLIRPSLVLKSFPNFVFGLDI